MKIVVCVKQICHVYFRSGMDPDSHFLSPEDRIYRINPYDESALQLAVKAKKGFDDCEIHLLSMGPLTAEGELRRCLSLGADQLHQIIATGETDSWGKSVLLARAVESMGADLILCGKESLDSKNGKVGAFIAHHLGFPFVSSVRGLAVSEERRGLRMERSAGRGVREVIECPMPAVLSVDLWGHESLFPVYEEKKRAESISVQTIRFHGPIPSKTRRVRIFPPSPRSKKVSAPGSHLPAFDRIQQLFAGSRVEKKGMILEGSPESQVQGLLDFLGTHAFLKTPETEN